MDQPYRNPLLIRKSYEPAVTAENAEESTGLVPAIPCSIARKLMHDLILRQTIDLLSPSRKIADALTTAPLFGPARGKMFGVMECLKPDGTTIVFHAFSGQYNGLWLVDGWAPPLFAVDDFLAMTVDTEKQIKQLGREIDRCQPHSTEWLARKKKRRQLSRTLMRDIHSLYRSPISGVKP